MFDWVARGVCAGCAPFCGVGGGFGRPKTGVANGHVGAGFACYGSLGGGGMSARIVALVPVDAGFR